jgi:hypothetical protein
MGNCLYGPGEHDFLTSSLAEYYSLPEFDNEAEARAKRRSDLKIPSNVISQLHEVVTALAKMYRPNAFHNFEHACHVTMCGKYSDGIRSATRAREATLTPCLLNVLDVLSR